jgi:RNA polymerase sigma-70 factor (ECF subfamily)
MLLAPVLTTRRVHEQEWGALIAQTAQGDQTALAALYDRTSPQVYGLALKILGNREEAEEVTLDVYTQVWRQAHTYDGTRGTPGGWLMMLARTRAIDRFRAGHAERGKLEPLEAASFFASEGSNPEQETVEQERQRFVRDALTSLSPEQREAIALAYCFGLSQSEIAGKLKLPLGTVKTRMRLGMIKLREYLAPHEEGLAS